MKDWSTPASCKWKSCCNCPCMAVTEFSSELTESWLARFRRKRTRRWSRAEMKKIIDSTIIARSMLGLSLFWRRFW
jgi:hypothetical protein